MGMVPVPVISPLTISRSDGPALEPTVPISRIQLEFSDVGEWAGEGDSPDEAHAKPGEVKREGETESLPTGSDPTHNVNVFA